MGAQPVTLVAESGLGKSALLSNFEVYYRQKHSDHPVLAHYIGGTAGSTSLALTLQRILSEIKEIAFADDEQRDVPTDIATMIEYVGAHLLGIDR